MSCDAGGEQISIKGASRREQSQRNRLKDDYMSEGKGERFVRLRVIEVWWWKKRTEEEMLSILR